MAEIPNIDPTDFDVLEEKPSEKELLFLMACGMSPIEVENINYSKGKAEEIARDVYEFAIDLEEKMTAAMEEARKKGIEALENGETDAIINEKIRDAFRQTGIDFIKQNQTALRLFLEPKTRTVLTNFFMFEPPERLKRLEGFLEDFAALLLQWIPDQEKELRLHVDFDEATRDRFAELILDSPFFVLNRSVLSGKIKEPKRARSKTAQAKREESLQDEASIMAGVKGVEKILSDNRIYPMDALWVCQIDIDDIAGTVPKHEIESVRKAQLRAIDILLWINTGASRFIRGLDIPTIKFWVENREAALADIDSLAWERLKEIYGSVMKMPGVLKSAYKKAEAAKSSSSVSEKKKPRTKRVVKATALRVSKAATPKTAPPKITTAPEKESLPLPRVNDRELLATLKNQHSRFEGIIENWSQYSDEAVLSVIINDETFPLEVDADGLFELSPRPTCFNPDETGEYDNQIVFVVTADQEESRTLPLRFINTSARHARAMKKNNTDRNTTNEDDSALPEIGTTSQPEVSVEQENLLMVLLDFESDFSDLIETVNFNEGECEIIMYEEIAGKKHEGLSVPAKIRLRFNHDQCTFIEPAIGSVKMTDYDFLGNLEKFVQNMQKIQAVADKKRQESEAWRAANPELFKRLTSLRQVSRQKPLAAYDVSNNGVSIFAWDRCQQRSFEPKVAEALEKIQAETNTPVSLDFSDKKGLSKIRTNFCGHEVSLILDLDNKPDLNVVFSGPTPDLAMQKRIEDFLIGLLHLIGQCCLTENDLDPESFEIIPDRVKVQVNGDTEDFEYAIRRLNERRGRLSISDGDGFKTLRRMTWGDLIEGEGEAIITEAYLREIHNKNGSSDDEYNKILDSERWKKYLVIRLWKALGIHRKKVARSGSGPLGSRMMEVFEKRLRPNMTPTDWKNFVELESPTAALEFRLENGQELINALIDLSREAGININVKAEPRTADIHELIAFARAKGKTIKVTKAELPLFEQEIQIAANTDQPLLVKVRN